MKTRWNHLLPAIGALSVIAVAGLSQTAGNGSQGGPPPFGGPGLGGPMQQELKLVAQFDKDGDNRLNSDERKAAGEYVAQQRAGRGPGNGFRPGGFRGSSNEAPKPGLKISPSEVKAATGSPLYSTEVVRTLFLQFESDDWEKELETFHNTDVEVPARLAVDGRGYEGVGVHFRGMSSYTMVESGRKRSLNLSLDFVHEDQNLLGYRTLNLLNAHEDPSFIRTVLYFDIARQYIAAPRANFVRVVINGENWGVYVNVQQFNKDFVKEWFSTKGGARWKVPGSPNGRGSLAYLGEDAAAYKRIYEIKSKDTPESWSALIRFCKVLNETPPEKLEAALSPLLDIDGALKFLALENALINGDGYWARASDYSLCLDGQGRFHVIPYDANETFAPASGPGIGGGPRGLGRFGQQPQRPSDPGGAPMTAPSPPAFARGNGMDLDPLVAASNADRPLISKLLAAPKLRERYLAYVHDIAERWLDWNRLGPLATRYHELIADHVKEDTRKLESFDAFERSLQGAPSTESSRGPRREVSLKQFADQRRDHLLKQPTTAQQSP